MYVLLALLVSAKIEINSYGKSDSGTGIPDKDSAKSDSKNKTNKTTKGAVMQNLNVLNARIRVGGTKAVLLLAGVRGQS